jgi:two-component system, LytTR family, response regulator
MTLRALIVDDENLARQLLREYAREVDDLEIVAECSNGFDAVKAINELNPDLVLLDVRMPKLDGFEALELIEHQPAIIFTTAYDTYAMRAFEAHAVDYLLKPFRLDRFKQAIERARTRLGEHLPSAAQLREAAQQPGQKLERVAVKDGSKVHIIPADKLDYIEAQDDYIALHSEGRNYLKQQTISNIEALLDPARFARIHRSYIVNIERVVRIEAFTKDSRIAILKDGVRIPVSRSGLAKLKSLLGEDV